MRETVLGMEIKDRTKVAKTIAIQAKEVEKMTATRTEWLLTRASDTESQIHIFSFQ
jgi:hypothetical protein